MRTRLAAKAEKADAIARQRQDLAEDMARMRKEMLVQVRANRRGWICYSSLRYKINVHKINEHILVHICKFLHGHKFALKFYTDITLVHFLKP